MSELVDNVLLSRRDAHAAVALLGELQEQLESCIDSCLLPGEVDGTGIDFFTVRDCRRRWRRAERLVMTIGDQLGEVTRT